ncbi:hypothetical protein BJX76DRAFT_272547 [Aspergillus varians]
MQGSPSRLPPRRFLSVKNKKYGHADRPTGRHGLSMDYRVYSSLIAPDMSSTRSDGQTYMNPKRRTLLSLAAYESIKIELPFLTLHEVVRVSGVGPYSSRTKYVCCRSGLSCIRLSLGGLERASSRQSSRHTDIGRRGDSRVGPSPPPNPFSMCPIASPRP